MSAGAGVVFRRQARAADEAAIGELTRATGFFSTEELRIATELVRERLQHGPGSGYEFLFADAGDRLVGYACWGRTEQTARGWDLYWIAVDPSAQRGGLGRRLLQRVEAEILAAGGGDIWVETAGRAQYAPTRVFYERMDYVIEARLRDFYAPGDDKVIFVKRIG